MDLKNMAAGDEHYKAYVGPPLKYDLLGSLQFNLLTAAGLRADHKLCDIGCGSLRAGKLLIPYLNPGNYFGLEPNEWLVAAGIKEELGNDIIKLKQPVFSSNSNFELSSFGTSFDFVIAQSIFSHASISQISQCLREVSAHLNDDGIFAATFIWGEEDYMDEEWVYPGCVSYRPQSIAKKAWEEAGLKMLKTDWPHPNGQNWALFYLPANEVKAKSLSHYSLQNYKADVVAIPKERLNLKQELKRKLKALVKK
jgi:SAM-dependent methyltransferase